MSADGWMVESLSHGEIFFASPTLQQRSHGTKGAVCAYEPVSADGVRRLFDRARAAGIARPVLFGLVPFDTTRHASFTIPVQLQLAPVPQRGGAVVAPAGRRPAVVARQPVPAPEIYGDMVRKALDLYEEGDVRKIVLSRAMDVELDAPIAYADVLRDLLRRNAQGYTFAVPAWSDGVAGAQPAASMVGASPELLVRREGDRVFINPLAGSIPRVADPEEDQARREGLAVSEKDLREHGYVVSDIVRILREHCEELDVPQGPSVIGTDALWHLSTFIAGRLKSPDLSALGLACALHPTPAICGFPTAQAFAHIQDLEPFDREYFAGLVGWQREDGDGEWALTLRCARYDGDRRLRLYAGAGTVAGSDPESEIRETAMKMETFMRAIA
ncbi:isochorismate synthase [Oryzisolibacter propanilivorax]|uniref:isochorismate synthase n=1 Tax=Oryzisolibacter propanilivorax TaxID=1527607 RepID=A0A1G9UZH6_9BURK|nr:isochorismate synthase [Oryzisolibacter propanilivorax]SDM65372.1 isochorismate synthase [Oryzisolibacter propanilivorax]